METALIIICWKIALAKGLPHQKEQYDSLLRSISESLWIILMTDLVHAESLLKTAVNDGSARFRDGQWEAIDALSNRSARVMLVQRTGWGKVPSTL